MKTSMPMEVGARLGPFYVYLLIDPRTGEPFYVGKGTGARLLAHGMEADLVSDPGQSQKLAQIKSIRADGFEPRLDVVRHGLTEHEALLVEASLIDCLQGLTNKVAGHGVAQGRAPLPELVTRYGAPTLVALDPPVLLIRLSGRRLVLDPPEELQPGYSRDSAGWHPGISPVELLDATRGWWKLNPQSVKRRGVRHVVAVADGVSRGLYEITSWIGPNKDQRWAFNAKTIDQGELWEAFVGDLGRRVPFTPHSQNPLSYWPPAKPAQP